MFAIVFAMTIRTATFFRRFMPTSILLDAVHKRRGLKWGVPAMLLAVPYLLAAVAFTGLTEHGGWYSLLALLCVWNAFKFLVAGPVTFVRLLRVRAREARARQILAMLELETEEQDTTRVEPALQG
ncbi:sulfate permease [Agromyces endophyticus]|uniref:sulfate permease n=1 Tax=Agromyces sp. H17E-10 TaxID=2932244 RepID=UPI001FD63128|nr:sulfate permease [Agromyces sp. H17E-10]UOQ89207.1 sulfate permease [Agromyces sp. H17E-10]